MALDFKKAVFFCGFLGCLLVLFPRGSSGQAPSEAPSAAQPELWAGHQVTFGETKVPFIGRVETRTDSYVLAKVTRQSGNIVLQQQACAVSFAKVAGVRVQMSRKALRAIPRATIEFSAKDHYYLATPWVVGWNSTDLDEDGQPGLSIDIKAALCSGSLYVQSTSRSSAVGAWKNGQLQGDILVQTDQVILGSDSTCLNLFSKDSKDVQRGRFAYRKVDGDTTCESLLRGGAWPVLAADRSSP